MREFEDQPSRDDALRQLRGFTLAEIERSDWLSALSTLAGAETGFQEQAARVAIRAVLVSRSEAARYPRPEVQPKPAQPVQAATCAWALPYDLTKWRNALFWVRWCARDQAKPLTLPPELRVRPLG